ncbi:lethal(2) giant larvae protein isoform X2 [Condylostylus longicornis]|uniref:lethal(2) giant larvae protein isoform X2 n=1 Tax=Condylostylus longicornis TaxID=2530218 RepID=UPI00244DC4D1|nr:lethal(2) giant larvae protein isoform X2 [Condylostylus longicornis]
MLKFIRGKGQQPTAERQKLQKELFAYRKTVQHGFPHKPSAIAYDPKMQLFAIGTHSGVIKVFGRPGVEFYGQHNPMPGSNASDCTVQLLEWVPGTGRILSLTAGNQLILWEPAGIMLIPIKTLPFDGKLKKVSSLCCSYAKDIVWIGTEGGNVYQFDLKSFSVKEPVIYHDIVLEQVPPTYKLNPGAIESVKQLPNSWSKLLITYNRGLCVLWDLELNSVIRSFIAPGHGQSVGIHVNTNGDQFTWYHADGSYATWNVDMDVPPKDQNYVPYGPDPCKSINRLIKGKRNGKDMVIFSGGMPRSAYGDHNCVSVHCTDGTKICLDFTSKVIDFFVTFQEDDDSNQTNKVESLIVLLEEELCAFDLTNPKLTILKTPYLHSLHASAITCNYLASQVTKEVYENIVKAGKKQETNISDMEWPINGGYLTDEHDEPTEYEILLTGHEDGSVKFWDCTGVVLKPIYEFKTKSLFGHGDDLDGDPPQDNEPADDSEPPFRKAGIFDPFSDDPRLAVKKVTLCPNSGHFAVAGTAGQIVFAQFADREKQKALKVTTMNLVSDRDGFIWKGHEQLKVRSHLYDENAEPIGDNSIHVDGVLQVLPPAAITCISMESNWNLLTAGTAHGLILFDYINHHPVFHKCTLNPNDLTGTGEQLSRRKSFKKTLRESFRRLRKGRSTRNNPTNATQAAIDTRPIERQVEARPADDGMGSMVRCLVFAKTFITNMHNTVPTLWSATNASCVSVFLLHIPQSTENENEQQKRMVTAQLAKEIQLKHRAPVVGISIFDNNGIPLEMTGSGAAPHRVLIASEEQFKVFSLPQLKPVTKYKLTAHEGARVRRLQFATFSCKIPSELIQHGTSPRKNEPAELNSADDNSSESQIHREIDLMCLTNLGDILILTIPELKRQLNAAAIRREDINGISSLCFTNQGEALYMLSSSEAQRISLSTAKIVAPDGAIDLEAIEEKEDETVSVNEQDTMEVASNESINGSAATPITIVKEKLKVIESEPHKISSEKIPAQETVTSTVTTTTTTAGIGLTNGYNGDTSPNRANETISSSIGDITVDSVRDHLNSTVTTLCSTTTEETVGRLSVLSTQTNQQITSVNMKDITDFNIANLKDLAPLCTTTETNTSSVVIKSIITSISHDKQNGETETKTTTTRKESQF